MFSIARVATTGRVIVLDGEKKPVVSARRGAGGRWLRQDGLDDAVQRIPFQDGLLRLLWLEDPIWLAV